MFLNCQLKFELPKLYFTFKDREWAGKLLADVSKDIMKKSKLHFVDSDILLLSIPRGGIIVADALADKLTGNYKFNIIIPRKLRAPHNEEIAIGAVMEDGTAYINDEVYNALNVSDTYLEKEKSYQLEEIKRRKKSYIETIGLTGLELTRKEVEEKIVLLIDDGAATGSTLIVAARWIRNQNAKFLVILVPVAPRETLEKLKGEADYAESFSDPPSSKFRSVGQYYQVFNPVSDEMVQAVLKRRIK